LYQARPFSITNQQNLTKLCEQELPLQMKTIDKIVRKNKMLMARRTQPRTKSAGQVDMP
jgi:hypothetical protein